MEEKNPWQWIIHEIDEAEGSVCMEYHFRKAEKEDCRPYFDWANDEAVRQSAFHKEPILWEDHRKWFAGKLSDPRCRLYVVCDEEETLAGQLRLDIAEDGTAEIDYSVDASARGYGLGSRMLRAIAERPDPEIVKFAGEVLACNKASRMSFERAGFQRVSQRMEQGEGVIRYEKLPDRRNLVIATHKSWNVALAEEMRERYCHWYDIRIVTAKEELTLQLLEGFCPEYVFIPHWSYIIPECIYGAYRCVVFHMTDLPFGRGGSPLQNLIARGYKRTKISAIRVTKGLDAGDLYGKEDLDLSGTASEILQRTSDIIFHKMIPEIVREKPEPIPQQGEVVTFKRRTPAQGEILSGMSPERIYDQIRMLDGEGYPNAFLKLGDYRLLFDQASLNEKGQVTARVRFIEEEKE